MEFPAEIFLVIAGVFGVISILTYRRIRKITNVKYCNVCKYNTPDCICKGDES
jgi:hypothetical protein